MKFNQSSYSPVGWYVVTVLERFEKDGENIEIINRMCTAWENTFLVRADNILHAYDKILENENVKSSSIPSELNGKKGRWVLEGVTDIVPVYEEIEDLSEIMWTKHERVAVKTVKSWIYSKKEIEARSQLTNINI